MDDREFEDRLAGLNRHLTDLAALLEGHGEIHWLGWTNRRRSELAAFDGAAFDRILAAFGGMGSLNDLVISNRNGHTVAPADEGPANDRLAHLRQLVHDDATALHHDLRRNP